MSRSSCGFANCLLLCPRSCPDWWDPGLLHVFTFDQYLTRRMRLLVFIQYLVNIFFSSINIWSIFWFSINIWSIFDLMDATSSLLANIGCTGVGYCLLGSPQESTFGFTPSLPRFFFGFDGMQRKEDPSQELVLSAVVPHSSKRNTIDNMHETWEMWFRSLLTNDPLTLQKD